MLNVRCSAFGVPRLPNPDTRHLLAGSTCRGESRNAGEDWSAAKTGHPSPAQPRGIFPSVNRQSLNGSEGRQMVLFAVERRKVWRMFQSKAGVPNKDYLAQKALLAKLDKGEIQLTDVQAETKELFEFELAKIN